MRPPAKILARLSPVIDERLLHRYLGYPGELRPDGRVAGVLDQERDALAGVLDPCAIHATISGRECFPSDFLLYGHETVICVVTIGPKLEARVTEYAAGGDVLRAFVLDTLGSVYAEGTAEAAYQLLFEQAERDGVTLGCRISPGYGAWALSHQRAIFELLPADRIGVRLTAGLMMAPRKSVSFAAQRAADPIRLREGDQCAYCSMQDCRYRDQ